MEAKQISDAVLEKPYKFGITDKEGKERRFTIHPPCLACLLAIGNKLADVDFNKVIKEKNFEFIKLYTDTMVSVACLLISNTDYYEQELHDYIKNNLNTMELYELFTESVLRLGTENFRKSIILTGKMSLLAKRS